MFSSQSTYTPVRADPPVARIRAPVLDHLEARVHLLLEQGRAGKGAVGAVRGAVRGAVEQRAMWLFARTAAQGDDDADATHLGLL